MRRRAAAWGLAASLLVPAAAEAHHLGVYVPREDEITASFKRMKVFLEQRRADLLQKEFDKDTWVKRRMAEVDGRYRSTLVADMQEGLAAKDVPAVERTLVRFFCFIAREKVQEALERLGRPGLSPRQKSDQGIRLLAAAWRYYYLVDFRVGTYAPNISTVAKVVFEEAEYYLGASSKGRQAYDEAKAREALVQFRDLMSEFLEASPPAEARRP